jgi:hypothetical protein
MYLLRILIAIACIAAFAVTGISCSRNMQVAGWGSETTNGITAAICKSDGSPAKGATVRLRRSDYVTQPPSSLTKPAIDGADALTDAQGRFEISGIDRGSYSIEVDDSGAAVLLTCSVDTNGDTLNLLTDTLRPFAEAYGTVDVSSKPAKAFYVQVVGLERLVPVDSTGAFAINNLPAGRFSLHIVAAQGTQTTLIRTDSVSVAAGDTVNTTMPGWKYSRKVYLNTTATGASVGGSVFDFPVLVRLTNSNFNFVQAQPDGKDLRFAKANGPMLPYEIERWDAGTNQAEIWVKIDTVYGNRNTQYFTMSWGASTGSATVSLSNGTSVFDTTNGFQGVWHMNDPVSGPVRDATINGYNGTAVNASALTSVNAIVGLGRGFAATDSGYIMLPGTAQGKLNFEENGIYAISAWVYLDTLDSMNHAIVTKSDQQYNMEVFENDWEFAEYKSTKQWEWSRSPATAQQWAFVVGVRNGSSQYLFVNGSCVDSIITMPAVTSSARNTGYPVMFGKTDGSPQTGFPYYFHGMLDEIRMLNYAPNADWIKLCYMNQKENDALVVFK